MVNIANIKSSFFTDVGFRTRHIALEMLKERKWDGRYFRDTNMLYWHIMYLYRISNIPVVEENKELIYNWNDEDLFSRLPTDVLCCIFSFSHTEELKNLMKVSVWVRHLASNNKMWFNIYQRTILDNECTFDSHIVSRYKKDYYERVFDNANRTYKHSTNYANKTLYVSDYLIRRMIDTNYFANNAERGTLITKTEALTSYKLPEKFLQEIPSIEKRNPHRLCTAMHLFYVQDICMLLKRYCPERYLSMMYRKEHEEEVNEHARDLRRKRVEELKLDIENKEVCSFIQNGTSKYGKTVKKLKEKVIREIELRDALKERGLELRDDSILCYNYIMDTCDQALVDIVNTMCLMRLVHEYPEEKLKYQSARNVAFKYYTTGNRYFPYQGCVNDIAIKSYSMQYGIPDKYPWEYAN